MFSSVSNLRIGSLMIPFEELSVVCSETSTGRLKNCLIFFQVFCLSFPCCFDKQSLVFKFFDRFCRSNYRFDLFLNDER